jgi:hypothetical protein
VWVSFCDFAWEEKGLGGGFEEGRRVEEVLGEAVEWSELLKPNCEDDGYEVQEFEKRRRKGFLVEGCV